VSGSTQRWRRSVRALPWAFQVGRTMSLTKSPKWRRIAVVALAVFVAIIIAFYGDFEANERAKVITMVALALLAIWFSIG
jgi:hypothetical protein